MPRVVNVKLRDEASEVYRRVAERFEATVEQFRKATEEDHTGTPPHLLAISIATVRTQNW